MESNLYQNISELARGTYENCEFKNCKFENSPFNHLIFIDCTFTDCNLSNVSLTQTSFREVSFSNCKMIGLHFENCMPFLFAVSFAKCQLNLSSFYKVNLKKTTFTNCELKEVDFTEANLSEASIVECDCQLAVFDDTNLEKADLSSAYHYQIDPSKNKIKKAKFSREGLAGLLLHHQIIIQ